MTSTIIAHGPDSERRCEHVEVTVNCHLVTLRAGGVAGLELKQEAVAQGAELQVGFQLWVKLGDGYAAVYDEDVIDVRDGQEFLAVTSDDHAWPLSPPATAKGSGSVVNPPAEGWSLVLPPRLWVALSDHLLTDGGEHAAVILADQAQGPRGPRLLGRALIPADGDRDYVEGSTGYRSLSPEFVRDAALRARDERLAYLAVHNHHGTASVGFSHVDLASHERGYPALRRITGRLVGALVLTRRAAAGDLWLPDGTRTALAEVVVPADRLVRLRPQPAQPPVAEPGRRRRAPLLGDLGQQALARLRVGVIGLGGVGSLVVELLSRLGVGEFVLVDADRAAETDLSRLVGAEAGDLDAPRVRVAVRNAARAIPSASVVAIPETVESPAARRALIRCDWIFLASAGHAARREVNEIVHRYLVPATQVEVSVPARAGHATGPPYVVVRALLPGRDCLWCDGMIDPAVLDGHDARETPPGLISYDCLAAAEAVNHFVGAVTAPHIGDDASPHGPTACSESGCATCTLRCSGPERGHVPAFV